MSEYLTVTEKHEAIWAAYEKLSDGDKVLVDVQVKRILDRFAQLNKERKGAKFQMSRDGAMEIVASLGMFLFDTAFYDRTPD